ncbi:MAG: polysaccharide deacetylase [Eubacteriales bacterium]|nr:polysaccharide deacetylase [Eubacteriales bacterium]
MEDKKINSENGMQEFPDLNDDTPIPLTEEEEKAIELWKEKRRKVARKRRRKLIWHVAFTTILTAAVFVCGILYATGRLPEIQKEDVSRRLTGIWDKVVSMLPEKSPESETEVPDAEEKPDTEKTPDTEEKTDAEKAKEEELARAEAQKQKEEQEEQKKRNKILKKAEKLAAQYDYDKAIKTIKSYENYSSYKSMRSAIKSYKETKESCVAWPLEEVTHVFYHTLIRDTGKAFDGDYKEGNYNQVMTTIDEFNKITQTMYDKGYVMVSIYDMATVNEDGSMSPGEILLPPGKIPFILSQDDVCYYHYMDGDGFATKLIVDEDGKIRNEYVEDDGSISVGDYDVVPLIDRFVEEHPDFSYRGAKGIVALTGYDGILGYRTDIQYKTKEALQDDQKKFLEEHPDFDFEKELEQAREVAEALKAEGWTFASHTWGHQNVGEISMEKLQTDTQKFKENVDPLIGGTDIIIFAFGADLSQIDDYSGEKFEYLKSSGYNYYCNVDSSKYFVQIRDRYFRMGRRNLDGYRMYYNPELVEDLFDASEVFDKSRPTPVPPM